MNSYEQIAMESREMTQRIALKWDVISVVMIVLMAALVILLAMMIRADYKARKGVQMTVGGDEYRPQVLPDVQIGPDGTEYHRMGTPERTEDGWNV